MVEWEFLNQRVIEAPSGSSQDKKWSNAFFMPSSTKKNYR